MDEFSEFLKNQRDEALIDMKSEDEAIRADALLKLGIFDGDEDREAYVGAALDLNRKLGRKPETMECLSALSDIRHEKSQWDGMLPLLEEALQIATEIYDLDAMFRFTGNLAAYYFNNSELDKSLEMNLKAVSIAQENGAFKDEGRAWDSAARSHMLLGNHAEAIDFYRKALSCFDQAEYYQGLAMTFIRLAEVHNMAGDLDRAERALEKSADYYTFAPRDWIEQRHVLVKAAWLRLKGKPDEADASVMRQLATDIPDDSILRFEFLWEQAQDRLALGLRAEAKKQMRSLMRFAETSLAGIYFFAVHDMLIQLHKEDGDSYELEEVLRSAIERAEFQELEKHIATYKMELAFCLAERESDAKALEIIEGIDRSSFAVGCSEWAQVTVALAKRYVAIGRNAEALYLADEFFNSLWLISDPKALEAEMHVVKFQALEGLGSHENAQREARKGIDSFMDLGQYEKARELRSRVKREIASDSSLEIEFEPGENPSSILRAANEFGAEAN